MVYHNTHFLAPLRSLGDLPEKLNVDCVCVVQDVNTKKKFQAIRQYRTISNY